MKNQELFKIRLDVSSESSARQRIHMKNQELFSSKDKSKRLKCGLLQFLFGALKLSYWQLCHRGSQAIYVAHNMGSL